MGSGGSGSITASTPWFWYHLADNGKDHRVNRRHQRGYLFMIILGIVLLIVGFILAIHIVWILGIIALVIGLGAVLLGAMGHAVGGRKHYF